MATLYHVPTSRSLRVLWTLEEIVATVEVKSLGVRPRLQEPEYLAINPAGTLPALIDGDRAIYESLAICEYLAARHGSDLVVAPDEPERPEFVQWLIEQVPYYNLRHLIRPGLTGWAQVRYQYGASLEETKQKLEFDLYYIKHMSVALDLLIIFETIKTILLRKGSQ